MALADGADPSALADCGQADDPEKVGTRLSAQVWSAALGAWLVVGCTLTGAPSLPSNPGWHGGCGIGIGLDATLHGSPSDARVTWAIDNSGSGRLDLLWPVGYAARFNPQLEVVDGHGQIVAREGDQITGSCMQQPQDAGALRVEASEVRPASPRPATS